MSRPLKTGSRPAEQLKKDIDIPETILAWLLEAHPEKSAEEWEAEFLAAVDQMAEWAFHDACTGCNPVYPTIGELKGCYLKAFYGEKKYAEKYGNIWEVEVSLPTETHAAYPMGPQRRFGRRQNWWLQLTATCLTRFALLSPFRGSVLRHRPRPQIL